MPTDVIMPKLGLTMEAGTVQRWLAAPGEQLEAGQPLLEVETDKVVVEVESPAPGTLGSLHVPAGENVPIGTVLARIYAPGESQEEPIADTGAKTEKSGPVPQAARMTEATPPAQRIAASREDGTAPAPGGSPGGGIAARAVRGAERPARRFSSPRARKRAREANLDWRGIPGSGPRGRVIERDVLQQAAQARPWTMDDRPSASELRSSSSLNASVASSAVLWETPSLVQRVAAARLTGSFSSAPHLYLSAEARADALLKMRERLLPAIERRAGVRLTVTDLLIRITAAALAADPRANAFWDPEEGGRIGLHRHVNVRFAIGTEAGLVTAVLRDADRMGLAKITAERNALVEKAQKGQLAPEEMEGGTFTLLNLGMYRVDVFQAILNPLQSGILAVGRIAERPAVVAGQLCVRPTVVLTLSCDHRVLDGALGAQFLGHVVELIEEPYDLLV
jgi:pyruvate dehydrogenase E2 component (dihydrolipoamide acetyltransferase)